MCFKTILRASDSPQNRNFKHQPNELKQNKYLPFIGCSQVFSQNKDKEKKNVIVLVVYMLFTFFFVFFCSASLLLDSKKKGTDKAKNFFWFLKQMHIIKQNKR